MDLTQQPKESNEWDLHYKKIKQLFITEKLPLSKVMTIMEREHKFRATKAQYKKRIKEWRLEKNIPRIKMIKILQKQDQRKRQEGKDSVFVCHGQKIEEARLDTARLRYKRELSQQNAEPQVASPISDIDCFTPPNAWSLAPQSADYPCLTSNSSIPNAYMDTEEHINSPRDVPLVQSQSNRSSASSSGDSNTPTWSHIPITDREMLPSPRPPIYGDMEVNSNLVASGIYDNIFVPDSTPPPLLDPPPIPPSPDSILLDVMPPYNGHCGYTGSWEVENPLTLDSISPHGHWQRDARSTCTQISDPPTPDQQPSRNSNQRRDVMDLWDQATALHRENNRDAALKLFNRALDLYTKIIDDDDIIQLPTLGHIAWIFGAQGFHKKALELYNRTMAGYENNGGDDNLERLHIIHDVGLLFEKLKHRKTALKLFTRAQAGYKKTVGDDNPYTLNALHNIGHVYYDLDQIDDAISVYAQAFEGRKRVLGEEHTKTKQSFRCLYNARAARAWAKPVDILRLLNGGAVGPTTLDHILDGSMLSSKSIFPGHA